MLVNPDAHDSSTRLKLNSAGAFPLELSASTRVAHLAALQPSRSSQPLLQRRRHHEVIGLLASCDGAGVCTQTDN